MASSSSPFVHSDHILVNFFSDPYKPEACASILHSCVETLRECDKDIMTTDFAGSLTVCARIIFAPRTPESYATLAKSLQCSCKQDDWEQGDVRRILHRAAADLQGPRMDRSNPSVVLYMVMVAMLMLVESAITHANIDGRFYKIVRHATAAKFCGDKPRWPIDPSNLLPYGAQASVQSLIQWAGFESNLFPAAIKVLTAMLRACRGEVLQHIVYSRDHSKFAVAYVAHLQKMGGYMLAGPVLPHVIANFELVGLHFGALVDHLDAPDMLAVALSGQDSTEVLRTCESALTWLQRTNQNEAFFAPTSSDSLRVALDGLKTFGGAVYHALKSAGHLQSPSASRSHIIILSEAQWRAEKLSTPLIRAFYVLVALSSRQLCMAPGCVATYAVYGRLFRHCSGCGRTPYCSPDCQRRAWRHELAPHKSVCGMILRLGQLGDFPRRIYERDLVEYYDLGLRVSEKW